MKIVIKTTNLELTPPLRRFAREKINSLERFSNLFEKNKYYDGFERKGKPRVEAWLEIGKSTHHHRSRESHQS